MRPGQEGYRVAVVGASTLLGKELTAVFEERKFPVSRLVTFDSEEDEPELPIVDLRAASQSAVSDADVSDTELDFAFLAALPEKSPGFLQSWAEHKDTGPCRIIDLIGDEWSENRSTGIPDTRTHQLHVPFLDRRFPGPSGAFACNAIHVSPHPATIVISSLLLRLSARFPVNNAVAQVFTSASDSGSRGIEELQKQTVNLLSLQKTPRQVFGAQLAFNLLSRLGRAGTGEVASLEARLRRQLRDYLGDRVVLPALRLLHAPLFYSLGVSLYVETAEPVAPEAAAAALAGERVHVRAPKHEAPTPVEVTGSSDILVDHVAPDGAHPTGLWIWAVADNLRLAAANAVELAASLCERARA